MPQLFALAREYADSSAREVVMFSSVMRAQLAGVGHRPAAGLHAGAELWLYGHVFYRGRHFIISLALIAFALPSVARVEQTTDKPSLR